ncbi:hypothetical protein Acid345_4419 [Candidatus Koribacter versatilis Ellin345]|uniref:Uncharacterized protein n=1 Tax=Koribacter versatilis (strain Ellin345) TaxID=204669 RepID=Q1II81_KORVE|nr:hypothetical protein [Candidatus Koribacter versatilis]ABF43419.1 hypothetical protein Acid345_4419 [Candidatus Koribacter versatilis Ellin345]
MSRRFLALAVALVAATSLPAGTNSKNAPTRTAVTTWSRAAHPLPYTVNPDPTLRNARVPSPNGKYEIACNVIPKEQKVSEAVSETLDAPNCELVGAQRRTPIDLGVGPEALWSPDSDAVAVTHSSGGAIGPYHVLIYRPQNAVPQEIATAVRKDLARRFPACLGGGCTAAEQKKLRKSSDWVNVAAIRWMESSDRLLMMAWVPDSSAFGANLGRFNGYVVDARTGHILNRYSEADFKKKFKKYCGDWGL